MEPDFHIFSGPTQLAAGMRRQFLQHQLLIGVSPRVSQPGPHKMEELMYKNSR